MTNYECSHGDPFENDPEDIQVGMVLSLEDGDERVEVIGVEETDGGIEYRVDEGGVLTVNGDTMHRVDKNGFLHHVGWFGVEWATIADVDLGSHDWNELPLVYDGDDGYVRIRCGVCGLIADGHLPVDF